MAAPSDWPGARYNIPSGRREELRELLDVGDPGDPADRLLLRGPIGHPHHPAPDPPEGQQVVEPVMQVNAMMAGARQAFKLVRDLDFLRDIATAAAAQASQGDGSPAEPPDTKTD